MRDDYYLSRKLDDIWNRYFSDVPRPNRVSIKFGRKNRRRLGSIGSIDGNNLEHNFETQILINRHLSDEAVPEYVLEATIAHELCHYCHGFASPLPQSFVHPHRGRVVENELAERGLLELAEREHNWLKANWRTVLTGLKEKEQTVI